MRIVIPAAIACAVFLLFATGVRSDEQPAPVVPARSAAAPTRQPNPVTLAELKLILESKLDGEWEAGTYLKGLVDLGPNPYGAINTLFLVCPWRGDAEGLARANKIFENWTRPMHVVWTSDHWVVLCDPLPAPKVPTPTQAEVLANFKRLTDTLATYTPKPAPAETPAPPPGKPEAAAAAEQREINVELSFRKSPPVFGPGESIVLEARFVNRTNKPQVYRGGLGDKNIKHSCQIKLMAEGGKAWSASAPAVAAVANYKDIEVPAHGRTLIGTWDLTALPYVSRSEPGNCTWRLADIARPGQYRVRWWDGVFQAGTPLRSAPVDFQIAPGLKPRDLRISETNVFSAPERTHEIMKNVFVVLQFSDHKDMSDVVVETTFTEGQGIKWCPSRSARPSEYEFSGHWQLDENGELSIAGRYVPVHGATELPLHLRGEKDLRFRIAEVLLRPGTPPYTHTVELWITQTKPSEPSNLSVRQRLQRAIDVSRALAAKGVPADKTVFHEFVPPVEAERLDAMLLPRVEDAKAYAQARPWQWRPPPQLATVWKKAPVDLEPWPTPADAPELRKLLPDKDPAIRCLAVEALGTLRLHEDEARIRDVLTDLAEGPPMLEWNAEGTARYLSDEDLAVGGVYRNLSWQRQTVAGSAREALRLITGQSWTDQIRAFAKQLSSERVGERLVAAVNLGDLGSAARREAFNPMIDALKNEARRPKPSDTLDAAKQDELIACLTHTVAGYGKGVVPSLITPLREGTQRTRRILANVLIEIGPKARDGILLLATLVNQPDEPELRATVIRALGGFGPAAAEAIPALERAAKDGPEDIRALATKALRKIRQPDAPSQTPARISRSQAITIACQAMGVAEPKEFLNVFPPSKGEPVWRIEYAHPLGPNWHVVVDAETGAVREKGRKPSR